MQVPECDVIMCVGFLRYISLRHEREYAGFLYCRFHGSLASPFSIVILSMYRDQ